MLTYNLGIYDEEKQIYYLRKSIQDIKKYIEKIKENTNSKNAYKLKKVFYNKIEKTSRGLINNSNIRLNLMKIDVLEYLQTNYNELEKIYNQIIKEEQKKGKKITEQDLESYTSNIEENKYIAVKECLILLRNAIDGINGFSDKTMLIKLSNMTKKQRDTILRQLEQTMGQDKKRDIERRIKIFRTPEYDLLKDYIRECSQQYKIMLKEQYISSLVFIGEFFREFDLIKNYVGFNIHNLQQMQLGRMRCSEKQLEQLFTKEYLENLDIEQLTYLNVFWLNKFTKEMDNISKAAFIITDFDLWDDLYEGKRLEFSHEELKWELLKMDTLSNFEIQCLSESDDNEILKQAFEKAMNDEELKKEIIEKNVITLDFSNFIKQVEYKEGTKYREIYSKELPRSKNMFTHEIQYYKNIYNSVQNAYKIKDIALMGILDNLQLNGKILNWGIMRQAGDVGILNAKYILIGIDLQGMNMPIRLHIPKDLLVDWVRQNSTTNTIPLYAGSEDFHVYFENGEFHQGTNWITSPILIPSTERYKKNILKKMIDFPMDLYSHLAYVNGATDFPEHLKTDEIITKKGKKSIRKIFKREYINIFTGEIVNEDKLKQLKKGDAER